MNGYLLLDILIAYVLDLILGDPYWMPHPVRFIGSLIKTTETYLREKIDEKLCSGTNKTPQEKSRLERQAGVFLMLFVVISTFFFVFAIIKIAGFISLVLFHIVNIYFIYSALASKCMADEALKVYKVLKENDIKGARQRLATLVGRETDKLTEAEIIRGAVETTAENTVDGVISPLVYAAIGSLFGLGAPLVYAFKAISTLDSMVGYMNEKYIDLGRASAKADDAANYFPARLSGILIPAAAFICRLDYIRSFSIMLRDRKNHKSPNCAYSEAAVAGALGIMIGGTNIYFGKAVEKPTIGDSVKGISAENIRDTVKLMYAASALALGLCILVLEVLR